MSFERTRFYRQQFEEEHPKPSLCNACSFLEHWDSSAPEQEPRLCVDCTGNIRYWYKKMDKYLEENKPK